MIYKEIFASGKHPRVVHYDYLTWVPAWYMFLSSKRIADYVLTFLRLLIMAELHKRKRLVSLLSCELLMSVKESHDRKNNT